MSYFTNLSSNEDGLMFGFKRSQTPVSGSADPQKFLDALGFSRYMETATGYSVREI